MSVAESLFFDGAHVGQRGAEGNFTAQLSKEHLAEEVAGHTLRWGGCIEADLMSAFIPPGIAPG